jgi:hypothetical protein
VIVFTCIGPRKIVFFLSLVSIDFDRTPGVALNQFDKIDFKLFWGQLIRTAAKMFTDSTDCPGIVVNCFLAFSLKFQQPQVMLIKFIKRRVIIEKAI